MGKTNRRIEELDFDGTDIVYCSNRKCEDTTCARNHENYPKGETVEMRRFTPDKWGVCEDYLD